MLGRSMTVVGGVGAFPAGCTLNPGPRAAGASCNFPKFKMFLVNKTRLVNRQIGCQIHKRGGARQKQHRHFVRAC